MDIFSQINPAVLGAVPVIVALVQGAKSIGLSGRFAPILSVALGIGAAFLVASASWQADIVQGLLAGLMASGLYSGGKAIGQPSEQQ